MFQVAWDNGHSAGVFAAVYPSEAAAAAAGREWKAFMVSVETTPAGRREAGAAYQWEVVEAAA